MSSANQHFSEVISVIPLKQFINNFDNTKSVRFVCEMTRHYNLSDRHRAEGESYRARSPPVGRQTDRRRLDADTYRGRSPPVRRHSR